MTEIKISCYCLTTKSHPSIKAGKSISKHVQQFCISEHFPRIHWMFTSMKMFQKINISRSETLSLLLELFFHVFTPASIYIFRCGFRIYMKGKLLKVNPWKKTLTEDYVYYSYCKRFTMLSSHFQRQRSRIMSSNSKLSNTTGAMPLRQVLNLWPTTKYPRSQKVWGMVEKAKFRKLVDTVQIVTTHSRKRMLFTRQTRFQICIGFMLRLHRSQHFHGLPLFAP